MSNYLGAKPITVKKGMERARLPASVVTLPMKHPQKKGSEFESETLQNRATTFGAMFSMASHNLTSYGDAHTYASLAPYNNKDGTSPPFQACGLKKAHRKLCGPEWPIFSAHEPPTPPSSQYPHFSAHL